MYVAINKQTNISYRFKWLSDDKLQINQQIVNKGDYDIFEVLDEEHQRHADAYLDIYNAGGNKFIPTKVAWDLYYDHQHAAINGDKF